MEDVINILDIKNEENVLLWSIPEVVSYEFLKVKYYSDF